METNKQGSSSQSNGGGPSHDGVISDRERSLADDMVQLCDDFAEISEISAFLCHAFAATLSEPEWLAQDIISGARRCSNWMNSRSAKLREDMRHVQARYVSEQDEILAKP